MGDESRDIVTPALALHVSDGRMYCRVELLSLLPYTLTALLRVIATRRVIPKIRYKGRYGPAELK